MTTLHNPQLTELIRQEIKKSNGYISFARFMELALYAKELGYYCTGTQKFGKSGDFLTAPEISPLFAKCSASQCQQILTSLNGGDILELGAGSGVFAKDLLLELEKLNSLPNHYFIFEISPELRQRQQQFLQTHCPQFFSRMTWLDTLPTSGISGIVIANEVLDAMPVHCFYIDTNGIKEHCVMVEKEQFAWCIEDPTTTELAEKVKVIQQEFSLPTGYKSEINLMLPAWTHTLSNVLKRGVILLIDYGYGRGEYYHPDRNQGTLMCYYQHQRHDNPFLHVGLQDITSHVDFTTVIESATANQLALGGFTTQAGFLLACGLMELAEEKNLSEIERYRQNQAIKTLTFPSQMGEAIKVIALNKDFNTPLLGFSLQDRQRLL